MRYFVYISIFVKYSMDLIEKLKQKYDDGCE
jgi:hypothetical protein